MRLNQLGLQQLNKGEFPEALKTFEQVLVIFRAIGNRQGEGAALNNIGIVYWNLGQYPKALENFQQSLAIAKQIGDKQGEGVTLNNIGVVYGNLGQYPKALEYHQQALRLSIILGWFTILLVNILRLKQFFLQQLRLGRLYEGSDSNC